jgi:Thioesterase-like superfamily
MPTPPTHPSTFSSTHSLIPHSPTTYTTPLSPSWGIGTVPNGGYLTSLILLCASQHMTLHHHHNHPQHPHPHPHPISLHLQFLRRTSTSSLAILRVQELKLGSRISNLRIVLSQPSSEEGEAKERVCVEGYVSLSNLNDEAGITLPTGWTLYPPPVLAKPDLKRLRDESVDRASGWELKDPDSFPVFRRASRHVRIYLPRQDLRGHGEGAWLDQWIRFAPNGVDGRWTNDALGFVVDMFPPVVEGVLDALEHPTPTSSPSPTPTPTSLEAQRPVARFWYPTLSLTLDIKTALPPAGVEWLFVRVAAKVIRNGRMDLEVLVLDEAGGLVAISSHVALVMGVERNVAGRERGSKM